MNIVVLQADDRQFGLVVDAIHDTQEIVVKPLGSTSRASACFAGATIMGDGRVALILDVLGLAQRAGRVRPAGLRAADGEPADGAGRQRRRGASVLLVEGAGPARMAIPLAQVARLGGVPAPRR